MNKTAEQIVAIIPARGGSKGIPGKNVRQVGGKPLLSWSIEHARQTPQISRIFVSTDSPEIAGVARNYGAEVIMRPPEISGDTASSESCLVHALDWMRTSQPRDPDLVVFLQATSPMREAGDIREAIATLEREQADSLFSACRVEGFVWRVRSDGTPVSFTYDHLNRPRRQDAPEDLIENGSIYIFKPWVLHQFNNRLGGKVAVYRMPALHSFQIDEPADLELMERLMARHARSGSAVDRSPLGLGRGDGQGEVSPSSSALNPIKLVVLDFDGVLTDNRVMVSEDGQESVLCHRGDGFGLGQVKAAGLEVIVLSKEKNPVVSARCRKLGLECIQGCDTKLRSLQTLCSARHLGPAEVAYVGNDLNDLECLRWVGLPIAVRDAEPAVLSVARWITTRPGGYGAVREITDCFLASRTGR